MTGRRPPVARYHEVDLAGRVAAADPHALVALLYEELDIALVVLRRLAGAGNPVTTAARHERATTLLAALQNALDERNGGELAVSLGAIYRQMQRRLFAARQGDVLAIDEVLDGIRNLAAAWNAIRL